MKKVALVVGHSRDQQGAWGVSPINATEYEFNTHLVQKVAITLQNDFIAQIYLRDGHTIDQTYAIIAQANPDFSIEFHFNMFSDPRVAGTQTLVCERNKPFGTVIQKHMCIALKRDQHEDRGLEVTLPGVRGDHSTEGGTWPNALVEPFFGSNPKEGRLMLDNIEVFCKEILAALLEFSASQNS